MPGATRTNSGNSDFDVAQLLAELSEESDGPSTKLKQSGATGPAAVHSEEEEADEEEEEEEEEEEYEDDWTEGGSRRRSSAFTKDSMAPSAVSGDSAGRTSRRSSARSSRRASAISASAAEPRREQAKRLSGRSENSPSGSDSEVAAPSGQRAADQILLHPKEPQSESFVREEVHRLEAKMESSSGVNDALDAARLRHKTMLELEPEVEAADVADWPSERARRASALRHATLMDLDEVAEETLGSAPALTTPSVSESSRRTCNPELKPACMPNCRGATCRTHCSLNPRPPRRGISYRVPMLCHCLLSRNPEVQNLHCCFHALEPPAT
ncbi:unnamed protein product [Durusdinium trenchii]|uniref:Uncharacterized protein n=1 Tax=Durusdinium trenchii TaxID=1381693 RepID=A0ABP0LGA4_9DINO